MKMFFLLITKRFVLLKLLGFLLGLGVKVHGACTLAITINEAISASSVDYVERAQKRALEKQCRSILVRMNTPGGDLQSTRLLVEQIFSSQLPFLCLITPQGGHAGSAGAILLQACHVNGGLYATNLGAATPILGSGENIPEDLRKKLINDTVSWLDGITKHRGRNRKFAQEVITEAKALSSEEAYKIGVLDILAKDELDFLRQAANRSVTMNETVKIPVKVDQLYEFNPDLRYRVLSFIADPEMAYLLFMVSLALLYVELTSPGITAPGVIGTIGLVFSLVAFHKLKVVWGGLALILLGIIFLVLEIFVPSFGALGIGGLVAVFIGSLFLFDVERTGQSLPIPLVFSVVGLMGAFFLGVGYLALRTLKFRSSNIDSDLTTHYGIVSLVDAEGHRGQILILGETWQFVSEEVLKVNDPVLVIERHGLTLKVKKKRDPLKGENKWSLLLH